MEEKKEIELTQSDFEKTKKAEKVHSGTGLKVACGALALAVLGLGGFIVYDKFFATQPEKTETSISTQKQAKSLDAEKQEQVTKNDNGFVTEYDSIGQFVVDGNGDVFFDPNEEFPQQEHMEAFNMSFKDENVDGEKGVYSFNKEKLNYHPTGDDGKEVEITGYKLKLKNIISIVKVDIGQQAVDYKWLAIDQNGNAYLVIVKPGGMIGHDMSKSLEAKVRVRKTKYENVVSASIINAGDSVSTVITDKNGSHFFMTDEDFKYE